MDDEFEAEIIYKPLTTHNCAVPSLVLVFECGALKDAIYINPEILIIIIKTIMLIGVQYLLNKKKFSMNFDYE